MTAGAPGKREKEGRGAGKPGGGHRQPHQCTFAQLYRLRKWPAWCDTGQGSVRRSRQPAALDNRHEATNDSWSLTRFIVENLPKF